MKNGTGCTVNKFTDGTMLGGNASTLKDKIRFRVTLANWRNDLKLPGNQMKFSKDNRKFLYLEQNNHMYKYRLGNNWLGFSTSEKDLGIGVNCKLILKQYAP